MSKTIHIAIGNSDDRLPQSRWSDYAAKVDAVVEAYAEHVYGRWYSLPDARFQNACWAFEVRPGVEASVKHWLGVVAADFEQASVAWNESETQFVTAAAPVSSPT